MAEVFDPFDSAAQGSSIVDPFDPGYEKPGIVVPSLKRLGGRLVQGTGQALADAGVENPLTDIGRGIVERNPSAIGGLADVVENPLTFVGETLTDTGGQVAASVAGKAAGTLAGRALGAKIGGALGAFGGPVAPATVPAGAVAGGLLGGKIGGYLGSSLPLLAQSYGGIRDSQIEAGQEDIPLAIGGAAASAAVERLGLEKAAGALVGQGARRLAPDASRLAEAGKSALRGALVETPTEIVQGDIERFAGFQPLSGPEAFESRIVEGLAGAVGGAGIGGAIGAITPREAPRDPTDPSKPAGPVVRAALAAPVLVPGTPDPAAAAEDQRIAAAADEAAITRDAERMAEEERRSRYMDASNVEVGEMSLDEYAPGDKQERGSVKGIEVGRASAQDIAALADDDITLETDPRVPGIEVGEATAKDLDRAAKGEEITLDSFGEPKKGSTVVGSATTSELTTKERAAYEDTLARRAQDDADRKDAARKANEIRDRDGIPFKSYPGANAARKKLDNADDFEVKRLDKGQFVLARKADGEQKPAAEVVAAGDGKLGADAPAGVPDSRVGDAAPGSAPASADDARAGSGDPAGDARGPATTDAKPALTEKGDERGDDAAGASARTPVVAGGRGEGPSGVPAAGKDVRRNEGGGNAAELGSPRSGVDLAPENSGTERPAAAAEPQGAPETARPDAIRRDDGKPYPTALAANVARAALTDKADYRVEKIADGQFQLRRVDAAPNPADAPIPGAEVKRTGPDANPTDVQTPAATPVAQGQAAEAGATEVANRKNADGTSSRSYKFDEGRGTADVRVNADGTAYITDVQLGDAQSSARGKGIGTKAYQEIAEHLRKQGVKLKSTRWSENNAAISPAALRVWEKLEAQGLATRTGTEMGKVADRFTGLDEAREIPLFEYTGPKQTTPNASATGKPDLQVVPTEQPAQAQGGEPSEGAGSSQPTPAPGATVSKTEAVAEPVYPTKLKAGAVRAKAGQRETHDIVPVEGGFTLRAKADAKNPEKGVAPRTVEAGDAPAAPPPDAAGSMSGSAGEEGWSKFEKDSGTLHIPRADMPQIKAEHRGALVQFLKGKGIEHTTEEVDAKTLKPTQAEFSPAKVEKAKAYEGGDRSIIVSSDSHVVDGHHQWLAKRDAGEPIKVIRLDKPIAELLPTVKEFPSATASAESAAPAATLPDARTPKQIEREAYLFAVSTAELQEAAKGERAAFDTKAAEALRASGYEQFAADDAFLAAAYKEAKKRQRDAERENGRDPVIYQAKLAELTTAANLAEGEHEAFKLGFDHALAGLTKSTITGDSKLAGYEAARTWLKTPDGRAFFEGKRGNKLENTGADLKRWFDKLKADASAAKGEWRLVMDALVKATIRADAFRVDTEGATPGMQRAVLQIRDKLRTFKDYLTSSGGVFQYRSSTFDEAIERHFRNEDTRAQRLADVKASAEKYLAMMEKISTGLSGAKSIDELAPKIVSTFYDETPKSVYSSLKDDVRKLIDDGHLLHGLTPDGLEQSYSYWRKTENEGSTAADRRKPLSRPKLDRVTRTGRKDYRQGRDVTPAEFKERFGFADVGFGSWVGARQDQDHLNYAYDSFMDLADVLGIQPSDIALGGKLHFTIGALGQGKASAHYQNNQPHPDGGTVPVINVTNTKGDGTVAHEWFHALDFQLRRRNKNGRQHGPISAIVGQLKARLQKASIDDGVQKFARGNWFYKGVGVPKDDRLGQARYALETGTYGRSTPTLFKTNADTLGEDYWGNDEELFARAGESWVFDKLGETTNNYLVSDWVADSRLTEKSGYRGTPYPVGAERKAFGELFDALLKDLRFDPDGPALKYADAEGGERRDNSEVLKIIRAESEDFAEYRTAMLAKLPEIIREQRQQKTPTRDNEDADRLIAEQKRREEQRAALEAAEAEQQPATVTSDKALSEDELNALFDEAAAELRETSAEAPIADEPGDKARLVPKRNEDGSIRYVAEPIQSAPRAIIDMPIKGVPQNATADQKAAVMLAEAAKLGVKGAGEALNGLAKLFGVRAGGIRSFPGVRIDPETYAQAKPHFQAALKAFTEAGKTIKDLFRFLIQNFGEGIKPYAVQFARDEGLGSDLATNPPAAQTSTQESTANVPDRQGPARDDRAGDADQSAEPARQPQGERGAASGDRPANEAGEGIVSGSGGDAAQGGNAGSAAETDARPAAAADDAAAGSGGGSTGTGNRVPERKRDGRNYLAPAGSLTREGSWRATAARNLDIVELVQRLDTEKRQATAEEQAQLVKFTGWGASEIAQGLFPQQDSWAKPEWKDLVARRAKLMSAAERNAAARTTQYAHYTSESVIRGIWTAMRGMGFEGGNILEPGMGVGLFATAAPENVMAQSRYTGIEYDSFTARIGKQLLQRENIIEGDYTKTKLPKDFFDVAIGNPPFGKTLIVNDPEYAKLRFPLHDYFFAKTIDRVRPGGLVVFVTSRYTMDKNGARARQYLADRADLLGAIRLPQTAFKDNAGTEVVTDVLFLRKRKEGEASGGEAWTGLKEIEEKGADGRPFLVNEYFVAHPEMVLGKHSSAGTMYAAKQYTVEPTEGTSIEDALAKAVETLPKGVYTPKSDVRAAVQQTIERDFNPKSKKEGTLYVSDKGDLMRVESGSGVSLASQLEKPLSPKDAAWVKSYVPLRDAVKQAQYDQLTDGEWEKSLKALNKLYADFVKKHGNIREFTKVERESIDKDTGEKETSSFYRWKNAKLLFLDVESPIVEMLEAISEDDKIGKSPFLLGRTIQKPVRREIAGTNDALLVSLDERGRLDLDYVAELAKKSRDDVISDLGETIFEAPNGDWKMADEYLSGDVVTKLEEAEAAADVNAKFQRNVQALIKVQPKPLAPKDITVQIGASWIPTEVYEGFADEVLNASITIQHVPQANTWKIEGGGGRAARQSANDWGTPDRSAVEIFETALMGKDLKITRKDSDGKQFTDKDATAAVNDKLKRMREEFGRWVWTDAKRGERLAALYNRGFNNLAPRTFDGSHLTLPGLSLRYKLYPHQKRAIWRVVQTGNTYLAHAVGAGKTLEMIVAGMEMKRLGLISKPMYAVPKHMLKQFASEFLDAYPTANVLVADDENFDKANRGRFVAQAALNNPDAIIITHPSFTRLSVKDETRQRVADRFIRDLTAAIAEEGDKFRRKEMEAQLERLEKRFESKTGKKDDVVDFEDLGVDFVFVDEAHIFRKLDFISRRGSIKGIDPSGSARALDLFIKLQHLEAQRPGRAGVLASGTPVVNTMAELFSIMRMMDMKQIEADGMDHFDMWANQFGDVRRELEQNAAGQYEFVERFAQFVNVPELMSRVRGFMDVLTSSQLGDLVKRPDLEGNQPDLIINPTSDRLSDYLKTELAQRIETSRKWKPSPGEKGNPDPLINIITDGRLAAIDMRFVKTMKDDPDSKLNRMLEEIVSKHKLISDRAYTDKETGNPDLIRGGTQIVFSAVGFGDEVAKSRGFDVRGEIVKKLTEGGIRRDQIAFMNDFGTDAKKAQLFKDMRAGKVRVLFGSPANMGTGVNVQKRLSFLHFLSPPWYPADVEQPHGRIIRQGNQNTAVGIKWYATKGTYDSTMWQMVSRKAKFVESAFTGDADVRKLEDVSESSQYEMASALSSGDQRAIQLAGLNADIERMQRLRGAHEQEQGAFRARVSSLGFSLKSVRERIGRYEKAEKEIGGYVSEITFDTGKATLKDRVEIGEAARDAMVRLLNEWTPKEEKGSYGEPEIEVGKVMGKYPLIAEGAVGIVLNGVPQKRVNLTLILPQDIEQALEFSQGNPENLDPAGLATRIRNKINGVSSELQEARAKEREYLNEREKLQARIGAQFQFEQDLFDKTAEAARLKQELAADGKKKEEGDADAPLETRAMDSHSVETGARYAAYQKLGTQRVLPAQTLKDAIAIVGFDPGVKLRMSDKLDDKVPMRYLATEGVVEVNRKMLPSLDRAAAAEYMAEELLHAMDAESKVSRLSDSDRLRPGGDLREEAQAHLDAKGAYAKFLRYPLKYGPIKDDEPRIRAELFARLGVLYFGNPEAFRRAFPKSYEAYRGTFALAGNGNPAAVRGEVREDSRGAGARRGEQRNMGRDDRRDAGSDQDRRGAKGLDAYRDAAREIFRSGVSGEANPDVLETRSRDAIPQIQQRLGDLFETKKTFGWWHNSIGTQYHKAQTDKDFKRVFDRGQQYLHDVSRLALGAADLAPEILPKLESLADTLKSGASPRDLKPVADAIFLGTLEDEKVYTGAELVSRFKLNPKQVRLYRQSRAAIDRSLDDIAITDMVKLARSDIGEAQAKRAAQAPSPAAALSYLSGLLEGKDKLIGQLQEKAGRIADLKAKGYAPLMRFGRYTVSQTDAKGEQLYFGMFEDEADARKMERELKESNPQAVTERGVMSQEAFKLFKGISPDTLDIFAQAAGVSDNAMFQEYLKLAINNRSALKRLIKRKGIAGYNTDLKRVLAQFITSNARVGSGNLHRGEMLKAANDIPREKGDVKDEAVKLLGFVQDPQEEASGLRNFLFFNFLGGSVASAAVNMTQPVTMTLPYLAQWGARRAAKEVAAAVKHGLHRPITEPALRAAMDRAIKDGVVEPHQIFELQGAAMQSETDWGKADKLREAARKASFAWGRLFSMAEAFNRRLSFAAAFQIGRTLDAAALKKAGAADAYEFAVKAVEETQGIYNRGNRPDWARGAVGATIFTFKQFSISYLEFLKRLPRRERVMALGVLVLAAGVSGLPGADDLDDLIDTLAQQLGYSWNTKKERDQLIETAIAPIFGSQGAEFARNGVSAFLPLDVQGRMGLGNLIPGTGVALKSQRDPAREIADALGPAAGLVKNYAEGAGKLLQGNVRGAVESAAPVAVQNALKAQAMAEVGYYRDKSGRKVLDTDAVDAMVKSIGFQPSAVARESRAIGTAMQDINLNKITESEIADLWAQGVFEKNPAKVERAREKLMGWNRRNPESRIAIIPNQIRQRVKQMGMTREARFIKSAPREMRGQIAQEIAQ